MVNATRRRLLISTFIRLIVFSILTQRSFSLLNCLFSLYMFHNLNLEIQLSTPALLTHIVSLTFTSVFLFTTVTILIYILTSSPFMFLLPMSGFFNIVLASMAKLHCNSDEPRRVFFLPPVKGKYYPLVFLALISFFGGPKLDYCCSTIVGYGIGLGYVKDYVSEFTEKRFKSFIESWKVSSLFRSER